MAKAKLKPVETEVIDTEKAVTVAEQASPNLSKPKKVFNMAAVADAAKKSVKRSTENGKILDGLCTANSLPPVSTDPEDYIVMPPWFRYNHGVLGLMRGKMTTIVGKSDTGKTTLCIEAMKAAQEQGWAILYVETEGKTSTTDLELAGLDLSSILYVQQSVIENAWQGCFMMIDQFRAMYPDEKLLIVFDSLSNTVSKRDREINIAEESQKPGGHARTNGMSINKLISMFEQELDGHLIVVSTSYANMGSVGNTVKGGSVVYLQSMVIIETSNMGAFYKTVDGIRRKAGIEAKWSNRKNHFMKSALDDHGNIREIPAEWTLKISAAGIEPTGHTAEYLSGARDLSGAKIKKEKEEKPAKKGKKVDLAKIKTSEEYAEASESQEE